MLKWKVHIALLKAELEPYLGFIHSVQFGKPSLVCDFQELYRYMIDDFLIERCHTLRRKDFVLVTDFMIHLKMGKKIHLKEYEVDNLAEALNAFFDSGYIPDYQITSASESSPVYLHLSTLLSTQTFPRAQSSYSYHLTAHRRALQVDNLWQF
jgi:hypothetical protein